MDEAGRRHTLSQASQLLIFRSSEEKQRYLVKLWERKGGLLHLRLQCAPGKNVLPCFKARVVSRIRPGLTVKVTVEKCTGRMRGVHCGTDTRRLKPWVLGLVILHTPQIYIDWCVPLINSMEPLSRILASGEPGHPKISTIYWMPTKGQEL